MNKVIVVCGPTAVGKTYISIKLAKHYNLDVISGDSVSVYKDLNIGSAKPTKEEMDGVKHYLIDVAEAGSEYSAYDFQKASREIMDKNELSMIAFADQLGTMTAANTIVAVYAQGQEVGATSSSYIRPNYLNSVNKH